MSDRPFERKRLFVIEIAQWGALPGNLGCRVVLPKLRCEAQLPSALSKDEHREPITQRTFFRLLA